MHRKIRLIVTDVDGCLTEERVAPYDLELLMKIRSYNSQASEANSDIPRLTLCTGRPQPYVEALVKSLAIPLPAICENGGMIYQLEGNRYIFSNKITPEWRDKLDELRAAISHKILPNAPTEFQPGKETHLTLISPDHDSILATTRMIEERLQPELQHITLTVTENCLNLSPNVFDKGTALHQLSEMLDIPFSGMAAVGDTLGDLPFMRLVGYPMCPANAAPEIKSLSSYVAKRSYTAGLIEIIERCIQINRQEIQGNE